MVNEQLTPISVNQEPNFIAVLGALGGSLFDYFIDNNVKSVALFGDSEIVRILDEQAFWLGVNVVGIFGTSEQIYLVDYGEYSTTRQIRVSISDPPTDVPMIVCDTPKNRIKHGYTLRDLYNYSLVKRTLFDKVIGYQQQFAPRMKVAALALPSLWHIKHRSDYENGLLRVPPRPQRSTFLALGKNEEYCNEVIDCSYSDYEKNGLRLFRDKASKYVNFIDGCRVTTDVPDKADRNIYFFGGSECYGIYTDDQHTIASVVQRKVRTHQEGYAFKVQNCGTGGGNPNNAQMWEAFEYHHPDNSDVVVFIGWFSALLFDTYGPRTLWLQPQTDGLFDRPHDLGEYVFCDRVHYTPIGYEALGNYLAGKLISNNILASDDQSSQLVSASITDIDTHTQPSFPTLAEYTNYIKQAIPHIGSLTMSFDPFTTAHQHLIEESARQVDHLVVFVAACDHSFFPLPDRIDLVRKGTAHLSNVVVVPGSEFMSSQPAQVFAEDIAPALGITTTFPCEGGSDNSMFESLVREVLESHDFDKIAKLVPQTTLDYLIDKYGYPSQEDIGWVSPFWQT